ncbi:uncharacterized protein VB005_07897 [Metarhizium brunneum]
MPWVRTNMPSSNMTNGNSLKGAAKRPARIFFGAGFTLGQTVRIATICRPRMRKAPVLMAQGYPTLRIIRLIMMGKMTPPTDKPVAVVPAAALHFLPNQAETQARASLRRIQSSWN